MKKWFEVLTISIFVFFILLFFVSIIFRGQITSVLDEQIKTYGLLGLFIGSFILELIPQYIAPQLFVFNSALIGLPFLKSILSLYFGSVFGSIIGFEIGKKYGEKNLEGYLKENTKRKIKNIIKRWGNFGLFVTAISPLPYLPMVFGALFIKRKNFIIYGVIPRFLFFFFIAIIAYKIF